ncbi:MAG: Holliday junction branch migration DNA helicase RuvB [Waddliaceae bacterium]|nr:Holliday junction branch migration DNA helicase RuvB [Waddliaceae bacterium]
MTESYIQSTLKKEDQAFERPLRPQTLGDFLGQESLQERLEVLLGAAKKREEPLAHVLFHGPPGLGKTTLSHIMAKEMGARIVVTSGPVIEKPGDLAGLLTNLDEGDFLFIDEIHRLNRTIEEYLYPAMEDFSLDLMIDTGPNARSVQVQLNKFTLIAATTRYGQLSSPLRSRFGFTTRLDYYQPETIRDILLRSAALLQFSLTVEGAMEIAKRSRGTPRIANNLLRWVRDFVEIRAVQVVDAEVVDKALQMLDIDELGLDEVDKKILDVIMEHYDGGPVGLNAIAVAVGEDQATVEVYEHYLINKGFLRRTPRGRELTPLAYQHRGRELPTSGLE